MTEGPPSSEATSSQASVTSNLQPVPQYTPWYTTTAAGLYQPYPQTSNPYAAHYAPHAYYAQYRSQPTTYIAQPITSSSLKPTKPLSPPPSPPLPGPETYQHWDAVFRDFFLKTGLTQTLKGFEADMLMLNPEWEQLKIPLALEEVVRGLTDIKERLKPQTVIENEEENTKDAMQIDVPLQLTTPEPLETRKLAYVHLPNGAQPRSQSSINKSISLFLAQNQARNDASNRTEFLSSLAESRKRQRAEEAEGDDPSHPTSGEGMDLDSGGQESGTCARVDAKSIDRDAQMKYDIAKDDWGPLSRSAKAGLLPDKGRTKSSSPLEAETSETKTNTTTKIKKEVDEEITSLRHPGLDERLKNIEAHIAVRFVPNPPRTLLARLKFLEDHLVKLEKEYPPWAALHFNQPGRGWPPPPRTTPIIVPPHLRDISSNNPPEKPNSTADSPAKSKTKTRSSLHRAVMERLEVQRAINTLHNDSAT